MALQAVFLDAGGVLVNPNWTRVSEALAGRGVAISLTDCYRQTDYGESIVALKSYFVSLCSDEDRMVTIIPKVLQAGA